MIDRLRFENSSLRQRLESLLDEARRNEDKQERFDLLERRLIAARSLPELVRLLLEDYRAAFGIEHVSLSLIDPECEIARIFGSQRPAGLRLHEDAAIFTSVCASGARAWLQPYEAGIHAALLGETARNIASVAVLPLLRGDELIGSLNLGSGIAERYNPDAGTRFLDRVAAVVTICIDNALAHERLKCAGLTDALTGVQNRRYFEHRCLAEVCQAQRHRQPLACMFLDIDRFKRINDTWGHQTGDAVLRSVASLVQDQLRTGDTIARYGGEEFVVLLPQTAAVHAQDIAERIRAAVSGSCFRATGGETVPVTLSVGLSMLDTGSAGRTDGESDLATEMIAAADRALYEAKHAGRNRVVTALGQLSCRRSGGLRFWTRLTRAMRACLRRPASCLESLRRQWQRA